MRHGRCWLTQPMELENLTSRQDINEQLLVDLRLQPKPPRVTHVGGSEWGRQSPAQQFVWSQKVNLAAVLYQSFKTITCTDRCRQEVKWKWCWVKTTILRLSYKSVGRCLITSVRLPGSSLLHSGSYPPRLVWNLPSSNVCLCPLGDNKQTY